MKTSQVGIDLIKRFESCRLVAYQDIVGVWTIGYGSTKGVYEGMRITQQQAEDVLAQRLANEFEPGVMKAINGAPTTQNQFDAMVSLAWNIGVGAFHNSHVAIDHWNGNYEAAANAFALWNKAGGRVVEPLVKRRAAEASVYRGETAATPVIDFGVYKAAKAMQQALQAIGLYTGTIDGKWGPQSRAAYDEFNRRV
jgi:lysozyme